MRIVSSPAISRVLVLLVLGGGAGLIAYLGTRGGDVPPPSGIGSPTPGPATAIVLPHQEPLLPAGPHREVFQSNCTVCHSPRLVLTQPVLTEKQWKGVIDKMVKVYKAQSNEEQQKQVLEYVTNLSGESKQVAAK